MTIVNVPAQDWFQFGPRGSVNIHNKARVPFSTLWPQASYRGTSVLIIN
jgi:hypothetical protein